MPYLVKMLSKIKGVTIVDSTNHDYSLDDSLSKEDGECLVRETFAPAYSEVLKAEKSGKEYPDISELFSEIEA